MAVNDQWYYSDKKGPDGKRIPTKRHGKTPTSRWRVSYIDPNGERQFKFFAREREAKDFDSEVQADVTRGTYQDRRRGQMTFREYGEQWRANQIHRDSTARSARIHLHTHVYPVIGDRPLASLRPSDIQALVRRISESLAPSTTRVVYRRVTGILEDAVRDERIIKTPCAGIKLPRRGRVEVTPLPIEAINGLREALPERYRALVDLGVGSGLRSGEMFGLEVDKVDFLRRTITVDRQLVYLGGQGRPFLATPKTFSSVRTVPVGKYVIDALAAHLAAFPASEVEVLDRIDLKRPHLRTARFIFTSTRATPINRTSFARYTLTPALEATRVALLGDRPTAESKALAATLDAAVKGNDGHRRKGLGLHALRHFYASLLIHHGCSVKEVQARLGHASATETLDTYSHLWPSSEDRTREAIDTVMLSQTPQRRAVG